MKAPASHCPREHLAAAGRDYPNAWQIADRFRAERGRGLPDWSDWCFLPLDRWAAIVSGTGSNCDPNNQIGDLTRLGALGAWRVSQGIYRFDPALYTALASTPIDGDLPYEVLYRLPEWCVYVETPDFEWIPGDRVHGFFAHLEEDANFGHGQLCLLLDLDSKLWAMSVHMGPWPLSEAITKGMEVRARYFTFSALVYQMMCSSGDAEVLAAKIAPMISLLLYLCADGAEIGDGTRAPVRPTPKRTKSGPRLFPPEQQTVWDVGVRIGAALRRSFHAAETARGTGDGRTSPRAHVRRAHWHGFRAGPMKAPDGSPIPAEARDFQVKWLPPISVNVDDIDALPATVRPVRSTQTDR